MPDLNPPAWNVYHRIGDLDDMIVDGAATLRDAKALAADALGGRF